MKTIDDMTTARKTYRIERCDTGSMRRPWRVIREADDVPLAMCASEYEALQWIRHQARHV